VAPAAVAVPVQVRADRADFSWQICF
jgi:hypothetical protein